MSLLLALLPVSTAGVLILLWRWSALSAALAGATTAVAITALWKDFALTKPLWRAVVVDTSAYSINISLVLLGGVLLYQAMRAGGGLDRIADWVKLLITDEMHRLLVVIFGVGVFFESATGFGVGILVTAPLLLAIGYAPMNAAFLALLGQCAVTWGALAIGTVIGADLSGLSARSIGLYSLVLSIPFLLLCGLAAYSAAGLWKLMPARQLLCWLVIYVAVLSALLWLSTYWFGVELAGCVAGALLVVFGVFVASKPEVDTAIPVPWRSLLPFALLVAGLLSSRFVLPLQEWLQGFSIAGFAPFYHPGFWLLSAAALATTVLPASRQQAAVWLPGGLRQWCLAMLAVTGFLFVGQMMKYSGMTAVLAQSVSAASGVYFALFAPALGALGGFLTASNASSNALFMEFQVKTATTVGMPVELAAAAQNAAGSNATLASPGRVIFAASIVGGESAESELLRRVILVAIGGALGTAVLTLLLWQWLA